jgi:sugar phosphate isomerase/epimerase
MAGPKLEELRSVISGSGIRVTSVAAVYQGESYADIAAVRDTVGLLPAATRAARLEDTKRCADFAHAMGAFYVSSHVGYVPEEKSHPDYGGLVSALQEICDYIRRSSQNFNLETGQETAELLREFIHDVSRENLGVNFDPANMIMYGTGDPIEALDVLAPWVRGVHCKDGDWPKAPGALGEERPLGQGQVGMERFLAKLKGIGYVGPITIEREVPGEQQMEDFLVAKRLLDGIRAKLGI